MTEKPSALPVDAHVHFHRRDAVGPTLDAAADNFRRVSGRSTGLIGILLLAQSRRERVFESLIEQPLPDWQIDAAAGERETVFARRAGMSIAVVCGRQVQAAQGIEVIALGTRHTFQEGMPLRETIEAVLASGALPVVPWGLGKWRGQRGRCVAAVLESLGPSQVAVGDNGSRLQGLGMPRSVRDLQARGFAVLPGTDPFPIAGDYRRVGRFGFLADVDPAKPAAPWAHLSAWLRDHRGSPPAYGDASGPGRFVVNQVGIQLRKRALGARIA